MSLITGHQHSTRYGGGTKNIQKIATQKQAGGAHLPNKVVRVQNRNQTRFGTIVRNRNFSVPIEEGSDNFTLPHESTGLCNENRKFFLRPQPDSLLLHSEHGQAGYGRELLPRLPNAGHGGVLSPTVSETSEISNQTEIIVS